VVRISGPELISFCLQISTFWVSGVGRSTGADGPGRPSSDIAVENVPPTPAEEATSITMGHRIKLPIIGNSQVKLTLALPIPMGL
jgi:hypothetical protein